MDSMTSMMMSCCPSTPAMNMNTMNMMPPMWPMTSPMMMSPMMFNNPMCSTLPSNVPSWSCPPSMMMPKNIAELRCMPCRPCNWTEFCSMSNPIKMMDNCGQRCFTLMLDMHVFKPEEVKVSLKNRMCCVEACCEEKLDTTKVDPSMASLYPTLLSSAKGCVKRTYTREFMLPEDCKPETLKCFMNPEGFLCFECPLPSMPMPTTMTPPMMSMMSPMMSSMTPSKAMMGGLESSTTCPTSTAMWARGFGCNAVPMTVTMKN